MAIREIFDNKGKLGIDELIEYCNQKIGSNSSSHKKKRRLIATLAFAFVASFNTTSEAIECGDCNNDGMINTVDSLVASQYGVGLISLPDTQFFACNVQGVRGGPSLPGTTVDVLDSLTLAQYAVGLISDLNCILSGVIVFERDANIFRMDADGTNISQLTFDPGRHGQPEISPDGLEVMYSTLNPPIEADLYLISITGGTPIRITNEPGDSKFPDWSDTANQIIFDRGWPRGQTDIYRANPNGSNEVRLTTDTAYDMHSSFSPNGQRFVFTTNRNGNDDEIYRANAIDGSGLVNLTNDRLHDRFASYSSTGDIILFVSNRAGDWEIFTMNSMGGNQTNISNTPTLNEEYPSWTRNDQIIYAASLSIVSETDIYIMDNDGSNQIKLTSGPEKDTIPKKY